MSFFLPSKSDSGIDRLGIGDRNGFLLFMRKKRNKNDDSKRTGIGLIGGSWGELGIEIRRLREISVLETAKRSNVVLCTLVSIRRYYSYTSALGISIDKNYMRS